ncbi:uncharacterized protein LOC135929081 [Gordionus sp. m RMFG-2023]|uniref:uncharacterized protein LOC135929081 n=1 Tax=Gordionus sp. m RMFG-2023 TaxID=3053472 RepID=UPI0031FCA37D
MVLIRFAKTPKLYYYIFVPVALILTYFYVFKKKHVYSGVLNYTNWLPSEGYSPFQIRKSVDGVKISFLRPSPNSGSQNIMGADTRINESYKDSSLPKSFSFQINMATPPTADSIRFIFLIPSKRVPLPNKSSGTKITAKPSGKNIEMEISNMSSISKNGINNSREDSNMGIKHDINPTVKRAKTNSSKKFNPNSSAKFVRLANMVGKQNKTKFELNAITLPRAKFRDLDLLFSGKLAADDPSVIRALSEGFIYPPSTYPEYILKEPAKKDFSMGQIEAIRPYLDFKQPGFFVECGALDGETRSNSLYLEREFKWEGLLVEADAKNFNLLLGKRRKSYSINSCMSIKPSPLILPFYEHFNLGHVIHPGTNKKETIGKAMPCFPLYSMLLALNKTQIDYFSLDIEGSELDVLMTVPFDKVFIKVLSVEFYHVRQGSFNLKNFMIARAFTLVNKVTHPKALANDFIFVNNKVIQDFQRAYTKFSIKTNKSEVS